MTPRHFRRHAADAIACIGLVTTLVAGCATRPDPQAMVPTDAVGGTHHAQTVRVVLSASETMALMSSRMSTDDFRGAVVATIEKNKTFSRIVADNEAGKPADYRIDVNLISLDPLSAGMTDTVKLRAAWSLKKADDTVVMRELITTPGTANASGATDAADRLRQADEAAARNNIAAGLARIQALAF
jgi:hypothetical protein